MTEVVGESSWLSTEQIILFIWLLRSFSPEVTFWWAFTWDTSIFLSLMNLEKYIHMYLSQMTFSQNFQSLFSNTLTVQTTHWMLTNCWIFVQLAISLYKENVWLFIQHKVLTTIRISLHQCLSGIYQKGVVMLQLSTSGWCLYNV